jgi:hypothetical protein
MAADFPTTLADFLSYTPAAGKGVPFDVLQNILDEILAVQTLLGAGSAAGTSFTPTIVSSGGGTPTYTRQVARYRRFLGLVQITGRVTLATFGTLAAGTVSIGGLPVASVNTTDVYSNVLINWSALTTSAVNVTAKVSPNSSVIDLQILTAASTSSLTLMQKTDLSATADLFFTGVYPSA